MGAYLLKRIAGLMPTLLIVALLVFGFVHMLPGDPARLAAGPQADEATVELVRRDLGLDQPLTQQFAAYFGNALRGDFGRSLSTKRPVAEEIGERFMPTFWLTVAAMGWSVAFGLAIGIVSAVCRNRWPDRLGMALAISGISFPAFALGMVLMQVFSVQLGWLPPSGYVPLTEDWRQSLATTIMPAFVLGNSIAGVLMRHTRAAMLGALGQDYVRTARAKGLPERVVVAKHALRNALIPVVTLGTIELGKLLAGAVLTEQIFTIPGFGKLIVDAVFNRDYPVVQGVVVVTAVIFVLLSLLSDLLYMLVNPRLRAA